MFIYIYIYIYKRKWRSTLDNSIFCPWKRDFMYVWIPLILLKTIKKKKKKFSYCPLLFSTVHLPIYNIHVPWTVQEALSWRKKKKSKHSRCKRQSKQTCIPKYQLSQSLLYLRYTIFFSINFCYIIWSWIICWFFECYPTY